jgi:hypothetical protein
MATAKKAAAKKTAAKKTKAKNVKRDSKRVAAKEAAPRKKSEKPAPKPAPATKVPKKKAPKKATTKQPSLTRTVNMGPLRGDNSFPPGNKPMSKDTSRAPGKKAHGSPANDSTRGPGGQGLQSVEKGQKGGGKDE